MKGIDKEGNVAVIGLWHLGTVTAACLSACGNSVVGIDPNPETISRLRNGIPPVQEPGLAKLVKEQERKGMLSFTSDFRSGLAGAGYVAIAFDTPVKENGLPDLSPILQSITRAVPYLRNGTLLVVSSQVPVGTCEQIRALVKRRRPALDLGIVCVPENIKLGDAIARFKSPDFLVIGGTNSKDIKKAERIYRFVTSPKIKVDLRTAEMVKHSVNAFLACEVSLANELGNLCDGLGIDAFRVVEALRLDPRIGKYALLRPGLGFGGGHLERDVNVLRELGKKNGVETTLLDSMMRVNVSQNLIVGNKLKQIFGKVRGLRIGVFGLAYKPGTSAVRHSTSIDIIAGLVRKGASIKAYDPQADLSDMTREANFKRCADAGSVADSSDALLFLTAWPEFRDLDFAKLKSRMSHPVIIDPLNMLDKDKMAACGFLYVGVGRGQANEESGLAKRAKP